MRQAMRPGARRAGKRSRRDEQLRERLVERGMKRQDYREFDWTTIPVTVQAIAPPNPYARAEELLRASVDIWESVLYTPEEQVRVLKVFAELRKLAAGGFISEALDPVEILEVFEAFIRENPIRLTRALDGDVSLASEFIRSVERAVFLRAKLGVSPVQPRAAEPSTPAIVTPGRRKFILEE
jgi:hypothetical protein